MNKNKEWLKKAIRDNELISSAKLYELIDQLDYETLSQEWINNNSMTGASSWKDKRYVSVEYLENLLVPKQEVTHEQVVEWIDNNDFYDHITAETVLANAVDKGELDHYGTKYAVVEKPTIPKFIGEVIEEHKELGYDVYDSIDLIIETNGEGLPSISDWVAINIDKYARAYLCDYTIEKEPRYFAKIKGHENISSDDKYWNYCITDESLDVGDNKVHADVLAGYVLSATKDEWANLGINEDNADFVKVEELEE